VKDQLFLLRPGFIKEGQGPFYCADSVSVEGVLSFFPKLRQLLEVHYIEFERPRAALVALLGPQNQSAPVLVLGGDSPVETAAARVHAHGEHRFINDAADIRRYLSSRYGLPAAT
jgi:DUF3088 family protein